MLVPKARIVVGHGQMDADDLEDVMASFVSGEADVLLSTTIIESGLDIPEREHHHHRPRRPLRPEPISTSCAGRVGRAQAPGLRLSLPAAPFDDRRRREKARLRHQAIFARSAAGFKIAMRDLEIRGAGNLLGTAQSGHITAVGFDLYCQLLKTAVARMKGEKPGRLGRNQIAARFHRLAGKRRGRKRRS